MGINKGQTRWVRLSLLALAIAMPLAAIARGPQVLQAQSTHPKEHETDNAGARSQAMYEWYTDDYSQHGKLIKSQGAKKVLFSQPYERFLLEAAKRERTRYSGLMPNSTSDALLDSNASIAAAVNSWTNIGPTKANYAKNGGTLNVTDSGRVNAIVTDPINPNTIYVAFSGGGVWKSTDGGAFWQAKTDTLGSLSVGALEMDPANSSILYLGLGDPFDGTGIGLVKSIDGGDTWSSPVLLGTSTVITDIQISPVDSSIVLVATNQGLFRSTNAGTSYAPVSIATGVAGAPQVWSIASGGGSNFELSLESAPGSDGQIWHSVDGGATWTRATGVTSAGGINRISLNSAPSDPTVMYAMAAAPGSTAPNDLANIFKSTDDGVTWTGIAKTGSTFKSYTNPNAESSSLSNLMGGQGFYNHMVMVDPTNPNIAYFGGQLLLAKTSDGGATFSQVSNWLAQYSLPYVHADFHAGHIASNGKLYVGTDGGIFASSNAGTTFTDTLNEGIASHLVYQVGSSPANPDAVIVGLQDNGTRVRETNTSVFNQQIGGDGFGCNVNRSNANLMLGSLYYSHIYKSINAGIDFSDAITGITESDNSSLAPFITRISAWAGDRTGNTLYTYTNAKVYKTVNYATLWTPLGKTGLPTSSLYLRGVGEFPKDNRILGVVANGGRVFLTRDAGNTWAAPAAPLPNNGLSMSWIAFDPANSNTLYVASVAPNQTASHLWRSTDFGVSWSTIDSAASGFPAGIPVNTVVVDPMTPTTLYAGTHLGVYKSINSGGSWARYGTGMPLVNVTDLYVANDDTLVRAATFGRSVWEMAITGPTPKTYWATPGSMITFGTPTISTINVTGRTGNAPANASVKVSIIHPRRGELQVDLVAADSTVYPLKASNITDTAKSLYKTYTVDLSAKPLNGAWTLRVQDIAAGNDGVLSNWSITL
jgi:photosystem II stability/assembly factor-like uncharacterized protein